MRSLLDEAFYRGFANDAMRWPLEISARSSTEKFSHRSSKVWIPLAALRWLIKLLPPLYLSSFPHTSAASNRLVNSSSYYFHMSTLARWRESFSIEKIGVISQLRCWWTETTNSLTQLDLFLFRSLAHSPLQYLRFGENKNKAKNYDIYTKRWKCFEMIKIGNRDEKW